MNILLKTYLKLCTILQTGWGWAAGLAVAVAEYFGGHLFVVGLVVGVTLMDAVWGIAVSVRLGQFAKSELLRLTVEKLAVYGCAMFVFVGLDRIGNTTLSASVVGATIVLVEFWSSCASMLILFPSIPILRLLRHVLTGEIAAKLQIPESEVEDVLSATTPKTTKPQQ